MNDSLSESHEPSVADYAKTNRELQRQIQDLTAKNQDLHQQLTDLRKSRTISPAEEQAIADLRRNFEQLNDEQNKIALWMRENKALEIRQGKHEGRSLSSLCIQYMAEGLK